MKTPDSKFVENTLTYIHAGTHTRIHTHTRWWHTHNPARLELPMMRPIMNEVKIYSTMNSRQNHPHTHTQTHIQCPAPSLSLFLTPALSHSLSLCPLSVPPSVCVCV